MYVICNINVFIPRSGLIFRQIITLRHHLRMCWCVLRILEEIKIALWNSHMSGKLVFLVFLWICTSEPIKIRIKLINEWFLWSYWTQSNQKHSNEMLQHLITRCICAVTDGKWRPRVLIFSQTQGTNTSWIGKTPKFVYSRCLEIVLFPEACKPHINEG